MSVASSAFRRPLSVAALLLALPAAAQAAPPKRADLERALKPVKRHAAVAVYDTRARRTVYALRSGSVRPLASNVKLFTAAAALRGLGDLRTTVHGTIDASGTVHGDLYLVGRGDPDFGRADVESLAARLHALGLRAVTGGVVGDGTRFDAPGPYSEEVGGMVGALVFDRGRAVDGGPFQVDPARAAATRLDDALEALGVRIAGGQRTGAVLAGLPELAASEPGDPAALVALMNNRSDNFVAEMLTKALGAERQAPGTTAAGVAEIRTRTGVRASLVDGTGLAVRNRAAPKDVVALLRARGASLRRTLPVNGRQGTARLRGTRGRCRAKTGTLPGARVSALSGYCGRYAFSVLVRGAPVARAERAQDALARLLAR